MKILFAVLLAISSAAAAQPALKMMIPANPGGGWDQTGRALAAALQSARLVSSVQFENRGGAAGGMVGGIILNNSPVNLSRVTPVARLTSEWEVIVVPARSPYKSLNELLKAFRENPGKVSWGGGSAGGTDHILIGMIAKAIGVDPASSPSM